MKKTPAQYIREARQELEKTIAGLVLEFEKETGAPVYNIDIYYVSGITHVNIVVRLGGI